MASVHNYTVLATTSSGQTRTQAITLNMLAADVGVPFNGVDTLPLLSVSCDPCCGITQAMADNIRIWRDHLLMRFETDAQMPPLKDSTAGMMQIDSANGQYAVFNNCGWRVYPAKLGLRIARAVDGVKFWNTGSAWLRVI